MKRLLIVESPAKIKTISKFLGREFKIMSTMGHVKDLPSKEIGVTMNDTIEITYVPIDGKEKTIVEICKAASTADEIFLAPDPDREGEIIAWHIGQEIKKVAPKKARIHRISFNEITAPAVKQAIESPSVIDEEKVAAQQARRILDRWVGYEVSPILWRKLAPGLSAGRVQSVALKLICNREAAIIAFKPEEYWSIEGTFKHTKESFLALLAKIGTKKAEIGDKKTATKIVTDLKKTSFVVDKIEDKERKKNPLPPFMTSTIQQAAYNRLGFSVKKTMQLAQQLYEGIPFNASKDPVALITYMRTDSLRISDTALKQARTYLNATYGKEYLPTKANVFEKKGKGKTQDAHEAIRPIDVNMSPDKVKLHASRDLARLYELIWQRFVACQSKPAIYAQRQVSLLGGKYLFRITGSTLIFDGYLKIYDIDEDEKEKKVAIPASLKEKDPVDLTKIDPKQHFTQPPPRYTEASLVKEMEKEGIGRPSTYSAIMNTIQARSYTAFDDKKRFVPTELGNTVTKMLQEHLPTIMEIKFTAHMEEDLDKIAEGELERDKLLREFYETFQKELTEFRGAAKDTKREAVTTELTCPDCKKNKLAIRFGKSGEFLGCTGYPDCSFTANFTRNEEGKLTIEKTEKPKLLDEVCPQCGKNLRVASGKFGPFTACSGYPECKYIKQVKAGFACPQDGGEVVQRVWRGGKFWGCSNYPKCKFSVFDQVEEVPCPQCKWPFMVVKTNKEGETTRFCANKACGK